MPKPTHMYIAIASNAPPETTRLREEESYQRTNSDGLEGFFTSDNPSRIESTSGEETVHVIYEPSGIARHC